MHFLVNNAGVNVLEPLLDATVASFDAVYAVNVRSVFQATQAGALRSFFLSFSNFT